VALARNLERSRDPTGYRLRAVIVTAGRSPLRHAMRDRPGRHHRRRAGGTLAEVTAGTSWNC